MITVNLGTQGYELHEYVITRAKVKELLNASYQVKAARQFFPEVLWYFVIDFALLSLV
jgi:hypothetical protein